MSRKYYGYDKEAVHEEKYKGMIIKIMPDYNAPNPLDEDFQDGMGKMICWWGNAIVGHEHDFGTRQEFFESLAREIHPQKYDELESGRYAFDHNYPEEEGENIVTDEQFDAGIQKIIEQGAIVLPIYVYEHGGITVKCSPFGDIWDSGQAGYIYVTRKKVIEEYGDFSNASKERAKKYLLGEVQQYADYLEGMVYGYIVEDEDGEELTSCWGYYGDYREYCLPEARAQADFFAPEVAAELETLAETTHWEAHK